ncbi:MAG: peptide chain release factor N(5)-glutamine methyltransferase [Ruminococcaceae bacterium]|nr:peptide chain release factor N(5)-glutamine methyltransferase [Oscillospiraceae bacterium]
MKFSEAVRLLAESGVDSPRYDAAEIFSVLGGCGRAMLFASDPECDSPKVSLAVMRRAKREPLQYILGAVDFFREKYEVSRDCLIPRQDTELLVEYAIGHIPSGARIADLCTGSGCVGISILANTENTSAVLSDLSDGALELARKNAVINGVCDRAEFVACDLLREELPGEFFAVVSNPPYVTEDAYLSLESEIFFEPRSAFVADENGLQFYKKFIPTYKTKISREGFLAFEIGYDQAESLRRIAESEGMKCEIIKDYSGNDRVAVLRPIADR